MTEDMNIIIPPTKEKIIISKYADLKNEYPDTKFISVEGPAGAGKSTLSRYLAKNLKGIVIPLEIIGNYDFIIAYPTITRKITGKEFNPQKDNVVEYLFKYILATTQIYKNFLKARQLHTEKNFCFVVQNIKNPKNTLAQYAQSYETMGNSRTSIISATIESESNYIVVDSSPIPKEMLKHLTFKVGIGAPRPKRELAFWKREGDMSPEKREYMAQAFLSIAEVEEEFCNDRKYDFYLDNTEYDQQTMQRFSDETCNVIRSYE